MRNKHCLRRREIYLPRGVCFSTKIYLPRGVPKGRKRRRGEKQQTIQKYQSIPLALRALPLKKWESLIKLLHSPARGGVGLPTEGRKTETRNILDIVPLATYSLTVQSYFVLLFFCLKSITHEFIGSAFRFNISPSTFSPEHLHQAHFVIIFAKQNVAQLQKPC